MHLKPETVKPETGLVPVLVGGGCGGRPRFLFRWHVYIAAGPPVPLNPSLPSKTIAGQMEL